MPTKKEPTPKEREIARKKNHPVARSNHIATGQNGEVQPPRHKSKG